MATNLFRILWLILAIRASEPRDLVAQIAFPIGVKATRTDFSNDSKLTVAPSLTSGSRRFSRVPFVIVGALTGGILAGVSFQRATAHCDDWCLPPQYAVVGGAMIGGLLGLVVYEGVSPPRE